MMITVTLNTCIDKVVEVSDFAAGGTLKGKVVRLHPAGKGINVSRCLATLGHQSIATGLVGCNERIQFTAELKRHGIVDELVEVDGRTRDNTTYLDPAAHTETHVREEGFTVGCESVEALSKRLGGIMNAGDFVVLAGSVPPGVEQTALAQFVQLCKKLGARAAVDANGGPYKHAVDAGPFLIKPNVAELAELTGSTAATRQDVVASARSLLDRVEIVVTSMGADGAVCVTKDAAYHARVDVSGVRSTVGCGDALLAGFIASLAQEASLDDCLRMGVACGGSGARSNAAGEIQKEDVDELLPLVQVSRIE